MLLDIFKKKYFEFCNLKKLPENNYQFDKKTFLKELNNSYHEYKKEIFIRHNLSYPKIASYLNKLKRDIILYDIGADNLDNFFHLKKKLKNNFYYYYYDQEIKSNLINKFVKKNNLKSIDVIENIFRKKKIYKLKKPIQIFFLGSMIQYLKNHEIFLKKIFKTKPEIIMICGNIFFKKYKFEHKKILMQQVNMKPKIFYQYFYEINNFTNFFKENGYKLYNKKKILLIKNYI